MDQGAEALAAVWRRIEEESVRARETLLRELRDSWAVMRDLMRGQEELLADETLLRDLASQLPAGSLDTLDVLVERGALPLLRRPLEKLRRQRPQERAYRAMEDYAAALETLARTVPHFCAASGRERDLALRVPAGNPLLAAHRRLQGRRRPLAIRELLRQRSLRFAVRRRKLDGTLLLLLAQACLHLAEPWQMIRNAALAMANGRALPAQAFDEARRRWLERWQSLDRQAEATLARLDVFLRSVTPGFARALLAGGKPARAESAAKDSDKLLASQAYWMRQQRAVYASLDTESSVVDAMPLLCRGSREALDSLRTEFGELVDELEDVIGWLESWRDGRRDNPFPAARSPLVGATERTTAWIREMSDVARSCTFEAVETVEPKRALPGWRQPWRKWQPLEELLEAIDRNGASRAAEGFREAEAVHGAVLGDIERAREVVSFSLDVLREDAETGEKIASEGIENALLLVKSQRSRVAEGSPVVEPKLTTALAGALEDAAMALELHRLGFWAHIVRRRGAMLAQSAVPLMLSEARDAVRRGFDLLNRLRVDALVRLGWIAPPTSHLKPVSRRPYVGEVLPMGGRSRNLPLIYGRVFRLAPVEDPRFLIGRDDEMTAMCESMELWQSQRQAAVLVIGARGSGKTSLLNCAARGVFEGQEVLRTNFSERVYSAAGVRRFLASRVGCEPERLEAYLNEHPRIIILEELEHCYLRAMGGFDGLRELLNILLATNRHNLWILSLNHYAFRLLDRAERLSQYFSVQVLAMAVEPHEMKSAILMRHNLSGLRLMFAPPPETGDRLRRWRGRIGLDRSSEDVFFDTLYELSGGIFRTAFEMWLSYIERVDGGILYMKYPEKIDPAPLTEGLALEDDFTLLAICQHGSLTAEDHAAIFNGDVAASRRRLDRLLAQEILEHDPFMPGLRIRPEAARVVAEALHRRNLG